MKLNKIAKKILEYLREEAPIAYYPKQIAQLINEDANTVRVYCNRLYSQKLIGRDLRGLYRSIFTLDDILKTENPDQKIHGIKIEGALQKGEEGSRFCALFNRPDVRAASGNRKLIIMPFEGRDCRLMLGDNGTIEIFLKSTKYPLSYNTFIAFTGFLRALLGDAQTEQLKLVQIELGKDFKNWRLDGVKSIKLREFKNAWIQLYQHSAEDMRLEVRVNDRISLGDAVHILQSMTERHYPAMPDDKRGYI